MAVIFAKKKKDKKKSAYKLKVFRRGNVSKNFEEYEDNR